MIKTKIWLNILLDSSSSMRGNETIIEFNNFINEQKKIEDIQILGTLTLFNHQPRHLYIARPIEHVAELTNNTYYPNGSTALFDAINASMQTVDNSMRREDEKTGVLFVIITDGYENSSEKFSSRNDGLNRIRKMIQDKTVQGWNFVFLGSDIDKWHGENLGINNSMEIHRDKSKQMYKALARSTNMYAHAIDRGETVGDVFSLNSADYDNADYDNIGKDKE